MDVTVVVQATLHTEFRIDRQEVIQSMATEARRLGLDASWDWAVYRIPAYRRLIEHAGIGNTVSFALRAGGRTHDKLAVVRDAGLLGHYLDSVRHLDVFDNFVVLACDRVNPSPNPNIVRCELREFAVQLDDVLRRGLAEGHMDETLWFLSVPAGETRAFEPRA